MFIRLSSLTRLFPPGKATLSAVNLAALPDKGERLRTQVKELEDTLDSLSITAASQPGNSPHCSGGIIITIYYFLKMPLHSTAVSGDECVMTNVTK